MAKQVGQHTLKLSRWGGAEAEYAERRWRGPKARSHSIAGLLQDVDRDVAIRRAAPAQRDEEAIEGAERARGSVEVGRQGALDLQRATVEERSPERL
eukprot:162836-Pyramimonas_sp.AAC.1